MSAWLAILLILLGNGATGYFAWHLLLTKDEQYDGIATIVAAFAFGTAINGWLAIVLAELGLFNPASILLLWVALTVTLALLAQRNRLPISLTLAPPTVAQWGLLLWLPLACYLFFRPHHFIQGAADAGVYVNLAASLADTGRLQIQDHTLATVGPSLYPNLIRQAPPHDGVPFLYKFGFYIEEVGTGQITPQFYPQHPVWQAVAYLVGDVYGALLLTGLWGIFATLAAFVLARELGSRYAPWLLLAALTINAMQVWFARYPTTELLTQFMTIIGLWAFVRMIDQWQRSMACLAAVAFGIAHFTRVDAIFLLMAPLLLIGWLLVRGTRHQWQRSLWFFVPLGALTIHTLLHALLYSRPYFMSSLGTAFLGLSSRPWLLLILFVIGVLSCGFLLTRRQLIEAVWRQHGTTIKLIVIGCVILLTIYGWFIRPLSLNVDAWQSVIGGDALTHEENENLLRLAWYLSPFGIWLGAVGMGWLIYRLERRTWVVIAVGLFYAILYLWRIRATPSQIYSMRRYVPVTLPMLILTASIFLDMLLMQRRVWLKAAGVGLTIGWLAGFAWLARGFVSQVDQVGQIDQVAAVSAQLEPQSILIFNDSLFNEAVGQAEFLGVPLRFIHGHAVFSLRQVETLDHALLEAQLRQWASDGRSVYWVDVDAPETHAWPLAVDALGQPEPYAVEFSMLETPFDRRPTAINPIRWSGAFQRVSLD